MVKLFDYQIDAIFRMKNGCILCGGVGSGKSLTSLGYYYMTQGGKIECLRGKPMIKMPNPKDLYIITTARKRDTKEWDAELAKFDLGIDQNGYSNKVVVDSWNNIAKYTEVKGAFFIFDEQRVIGYGSWAKAFITISKSNNWILLSATPGDTWQDYISVFIANGFYKNKTEFAREHIVYAAAPYIKYPKIDHYKNTGKLIKMRKRILVDMDFDRETIQHHENLYSRYNRTQYKDVGKFRWDPYECKPIESPSQLCYVWRKMVNSDISRQLLVLDLYEKHNRIIIFYNFNYELDLLRKMFEPTGCKIGEWNGQKHEPIPDGDHWVYFVQYTAGAEGWNCTSTDTIVFYSQNYSYKTMIQAAGRIDRLNTPYHDLYYYHLKSHSPIDLAIERALSQKRNFNEKRYVGW